MVGLTSNCNQTAYLDEVEVLSSWCKNKNLDLNVSNNKEMVVDFRREKQRIHYTPLRINGTLVEKVSKSMRQIRQLRKFKISTEIILHQHKRVTAGFDTCSFQDRKALQKVKQGAKRIIRSPRPCLQDIYTRRSRVNRIIKDIQHPDHNLFQWLPSAKRLRSIMSRTERQRRSFFPQAIQTRNN